MQIYKRTQGKYTRWLTFAGVMFMVVAGAARLSIYLQSFTYTQSPYVRYLGPAVLVGLLAWLMFYIVNRPKTADFLIATEGEMKKVSWSSRKEIVGSTKVVIITTLVMAALLWAVDILFFNVFKFILGN